MSETVKEQKEREIKELEERLEEEKRDVAVDSCTHCGAKTSTFPYNEFFVLPGEKLFGWLECPYCGQVFCPLSIRRKKAKLYGVMRKGSKDSDIIV
jgi:ferredoxin